MKKNVDSKPRAPRLADWQQLDPEAQHEATRYAEPLPSRRFLWQVLQQKSYTSDGLIEVLGLENPKQINGVIRRLEAMQRTGELTQNKKGKWSTVADQAPERAKNPDTLIGTVSGNKDGFGFFIPDSIEILEENQDSNLETKNKKNQNKIIKNKKNTDNTDWFLSSKTMRTLWHGDRVRVRRGGTDSRGRIEGFVLEVLERAHTQIVGRFSWSEENNAGMVTAYHPKIHQIVLIAPENCKDIAEGTRVLVRIDAQPTPRQFAIGSVLAVLGQDDTPGIEIETAMRAHELPHEWSEDLLSELEKIPSEIRAENYPNRVDLRHLPLITIDGEDARDFDDAVCAIPTRTGWQLWVAIADVSHYVQPETALDREAQTRGNSVYFPGRVIPMLPEVLSNGLCSLNPNVDRLAIVCEMRLNRETGQITRAKFHRAVFQSQARLIYTQVFDFLNNINHPNINNIININILNNKNIQKNILSLKDVYEVLAKARQARGALELESSETKVILDENQNITAIKPYERNIAHQLIEECMIAANVEAAKFIERHKLPLPWRAHPKPLPKKLQALREALQTRALSLDGQDAPEPKDYQNLLEKIKDRPDSFLINRLVLRSLGQAHYTAKHEGHFGLALEKYAHFTSPIRRYPDLLVHRAIGHILDGGNAKTFTYDQNALQKLAESSSQTERRADDATRDAIQAMKCRYMQQHLGEDFEGFVTSVTNFGLFVEIKDIYIDGLVHITALPSDYWQFDATKQALVGESTGKTFELGQPLTIKVARVNAEERKIDFSLVGFAERPKRARK